ncbi:MAG: META domain-containing protein [Burkholderiaceae bacterium]
MQPRSWVRLGILALGSLLAACAVPSPQQAPAPAEPYRASGNEPFWRIVIDGGRLLLDRPDEPQRAAAVSPPRATANGRSYEAPGMRVEIAAGRCQDSMSGALYGDRVTVTVDGRQLSGCGGRRLPPERLEDTQWSVIELDGQPVSLQPPPTLSIDAQGRASGSDGCNRFVGGLSFAPAGAVEASGHGISTKRACAGERDQLSRRYNNLRAGVSSWRFDADALLLRTADGRTILLKQTF